MAVLALIRNSDEVRQVVSWSAEIALARDAPLTVLCCYYSPIEHLQDDLSDAHLTAAVEALLDEAGQQTSMARLVAADKLEIRNVGHPDAATAAIKLARKEDVDLIVAAAEDQSGQTGVTYATNPLLRNAPCHAIVLFGGPKRSRHPGKIFVAATDGPHDAAALYLANQIGEAQQADVTLVRPEFDLDHITSEVSQRELRQLIRDTGLEKSERITCRVLDWGDYDENAKVLNEYDLLFVGANFKQLHAILESTTHPAVAVIKRAPALRPWRRGKGREDWSPWLSPADYADLVEGLRRGSRLGIDFLAMLGLAAVVASLGLLQDSPAVVIGSMLLAPLMTPMLGCGLALAQANSRLGNRALATVGIGLFCTLAISCLIGLLTPGSELTPQIYSRGDPDALDLFVAAASAAAAAYALARPNLVGSIAGVAIATALVPPLCSVGLSLAYHDLLNASGAALLFATNFVAIVLVAAATFRTMGVTATRASALQRRWVYGTVAAFAVSAVVFLIPLQLSLLRGVREGKPQPTTFPLARSVTEALEDYVADDPEVKLLTAGRPSSHHHRSNVILIIGAPRDLKREYAQGLIDIVRREMDNPKLKVEVHCIRELWQEKSQ